MGQSTVLARTIQKRQANLSRFSPPEPEGSFSGPLDGFGHLEFLVGDPSARQNGPLVLELKDPLIQLI
jgi:hypothetical protein